MLLFIVIKRLQISDQPRLYQVSGVGNPPNPAFVKQILPAMEILLLWTPTDSFSGSAALDSTSFSSNNKFYFSMIPCIFPATRRSI